MLNEITEQLKSVHPRWHSRFLKKNPEVVAIISTQFPELPLQEATFLVANGMTSRPVCHGCGKPVSFFSNRYAKHCSRSCASIANENGKLGQAAIKKKYGVENAQQIPGIHEKRLKTMNRLYEANVSSNHISKNPEHHKHLNTKGRETLFARYGVRNPSQMSDHIEKCRKTRESIIHDDSILIQERMTKIQRILPEGLYLEEILHPNKERGEVMYRYLLSCNKCGNKEIQASGTFKFRMRKGMICTECSGISTSRSIKEIEMFNMIKSLVPHEVVLPNIRTIIYPYELDVFLPDKKLAFEFCGLYYHCDKRVSDDYHIKKTLRCDALGIRLIQVFEDEWNFKRDIIHEQFKEILDLPNRSCVFASDCHIGSLSTENTDEFCEKHHIQGYTNSTHKFGLYFNDELVATMTFARPSAAKGSKKSGVGVWELSRFCTSKVVVGGASKLFAYFVKTLNPTEIISYSDIRWNTGSLYKKLGFIHTHDSPPNYWYTKGDIRVHRYNLRKRETDDPNVTERVLREQEGWKRIYDCGNSVWKWNSPSKQIS